MSAFATVGLLTGVVRGIVFRAAALAMVSESVKSAQARRRTVNGPRLVSLACVGTRFGRGRPVKRAEAMTT
ncbi:hypothetical protein [Streptomyces sp. cmx-4-7]|uniref:hypothetical protein n=1 Tax=Streptomyces sp. cmx-4-7 TaxID=2790939 RepID=UPI0039816AA3